MLFLKCMKKALQIISIPVLLTATLLLLYLLWNGIQSGKITGVILPLYVEPTSIYWNMVINAKTLHPQVPMIVIINPNSGPGSLINQNYTKITQKLKSAGITVLGYIPTDQGRKDSTAVMKNIDEYRTWYAVNGILFDEMPNTPGKEGYYKSLDDFAKSQGLTITVGNPGTAVPESYVGILDNIIIYEDAGLPALQTLQGWHLKYNKKDFSIIPYNVASLNHSYIINATKYVGYIYITDRNLPNPWNSLPPYFNNLVTTLDHSPN
jgi:hypothetical protein